MAPSPQQLKVYKASAGSGKTFRLAVEYIALLVKEPTEYQRTLAVTFTNKATGEMKQRILSQLYGIANGLASSKGYVSAIIKLLAEEGIACTPDDVQSKCATALSLIIHDYSSFRIVTIDSFFQSIVRELANELGLTANISIELNAKKVLGKAVDEVIDKLDKQSEEYDSLVKYIESKFDENKSWKIDKSVAKFGENVLSEKYLVNASSMRAEITDKQKLQAYNTTLRSYTAKAIEQLNTRLDTLSQEAKNAIDSSPVGKDVKATPKKFLDSKWGEMTKLSDAQQSYASDSSKWMNKSKFPDELTSLIEGTILPIVQEIVDTFNFRLKVENDLKACLSNLYNMMIIGKLNEEIERLNKDNNRFLLAETAHFLRDVINGSNLPFIYEKTGTSIDHIMIDEFQDTSTLQWENFKPLLLNCLDSFMSCLIVGDVKQSIYRFRNSDWKVLNGIEDDSSDMKSYITPIKQSTNFRSSPTVIGFNNKFFRHAITNTNDTYKENHGHICHELDAAYADVEQESKDKTNVFGYVKVENIVEPATPPAEEGAETSAEALTKEEYDALQLERVFQNVKTLLESGVKAEDMAILVRKGYQATDICAYFEERKSELDVKLLSSEAYKLEASIAVRIIIFALRAIAAQNDRLHLATLAHFYQLYVLENDSVKNDLSISFIASNEELAKQYLPSEFYANIGDLRFKPLIEIVEQIYRMFQLHLLKNQDAYMFFFNDIVEAYSRDNLADIDSFLQMWDEELSEKSIPNGNSDGIQVMTIHKSKGLEFHTVIIPFCDFELTPKDDTLLWCTTDKPPYSKLPLLPVEYSSTKNSNVLVDDHDEEELLTLVDNINVMYVGFTRPVHNLVIITDDRKYKKSKVPNGVNQLIINAIESAMTDEKEPLAMQAETLDDEAIVTYTIGSIVPHEGPDIEKEEKEKDHKVNPLAVKPDEKSVAFTTNTAHAEFRQSNDSDLFISQQSSSEKAQQHAERIRLINLGNLYHNTLQQIHTSADIHQAILQMEKRGCFEQLESSCEVEEKIRSLIESTSAEHPEWFSSDWRVINERAILYRNDQGEFCNKRPDRVVVNGDRAIVIDYKTSMESVVVLPNGEVSVPGENKRQVEHYCNLLREIGYKEVEGYLWYILNDIIYKVQ